VARCARVPALFFSGAQALETLIGEVAALDRIASADVIVVGRSRAWSSDGH
jgi:hypothetical protein